MKGNRFVSFALGMLLIGTSAQAQTLFSYGDHQVSKKEFMSVYEKNSKVGQNTSLPEYLNLYALFRMKVQDALDMKMDTTAAVINELDHYKAQLTRSDLVDKKVTQRLVKEAYERMKTDIKVAHILIAVRPNEDSSRAKNLIDSLYNVLKHGKADFAAIAKKYSDDHTTGSNGGELGYITALQTPYHFETAAYTTPKGEISEPFRTTYGYDIVKVEEERPDPGQVEVAQILIASPKYKGPEAKKKALSVAQDVVAQLKAGADFDDMVKQYSDDRYTKDNKGVMKPFGIGVMTPDYEKAAYALEQPGDISQPVETEYGYHILKLIRKVPLQPLDSIEDKLTARVRSDAREAEAKKAYMKKVKEQYHFEDYPDNFQQLLSVVGKDTAKDVNPDRYPGLTRPLFVLDGKNYTQTDFLAYANNLTKGAIVGKKESALTDLYSGYQNKMITNLQQEKLLENSPRLQSLIQEYKNGILLFDLMDQKVWTKASKDTVGLQQFYEQHKEAYQWLPGFEGTIFYASTAQALEQLRVYLNRGDDVQTALDEVKKDSHNGHTDITLQSGRFAYDQIPLNRRELQLSQASKVFQQQGKYAVAYVDKVYPDKEMKNLEEARGFVVADYQDYLEKQWEEELKQKYPLKVNEKRLKKLERHYR